MKIYWHFPANDAISVPPVTQSDIISGFLAPYKTDIEKTPSRNLSLYIMEGLPPILYSPSDEPLITEIIKEYCRIYREEYKSLFDKKIDYSKILKIFR